LLTELAGVKKSLNNYSKEFFSFTVFLLHSFSSFLPFFLFSSYLPFFFLFSLLSSFFYFCPFMLYIAEENVTLPRNHFFPIRDWKASASLSGGPHQKYAKEIKKKHWEGFCFYSYRFHSCLFIQLILIFSFVFFYSFLNFFWKSRKPKASGDNKRRAMDNSCCIGS